MQRWRVPLGFVCGALFLLFAHPVPWTLALGGSTAVFGLLLRAWAAGHIRKNSVLATTGPYAYTRNPLYLGSLVIGIGFTVASGRLLLAIPFAVLFLGIYVPVMRIEAETLRGMFAEAYLQYEKAVPMFFPTPRKYRCPQVDASFDKSLYLRYREYRAALGLAAVLTLLVVKALLVH